MQPWVPKFTAKLEKSASGCMNESCHSCGHGFVHGTWMQHVLHNLVHVPKERHTNLDGAVVHVSLHPELALPSRCIASFAVGPPALVDFATDSVKPLPALVMGKIKAGTVVALIDQMCYTQPAGATCAKTHSQLFVLLFLVQEPCVHLVFLHSLEAGGCLSLTTWSLQAFMFVTTHALVTCSVPWLCNFLFACLSKQAVACTGP